MLSRVTVWIFLLYPGLLQEGGLLVIRPQYGGLSELKLLNESGVFRSWFESNSRG